MPGNVDKFDGEKTLSLALAHITERDSELLREISEGRSFGRIVSTCYGHEVSVPPLACWVAKRVRGFQRLGLSAEFLALYTLAAEEGCAWLRLDCDVFEVAELPTFEW